jgi:hypothetical protein
MLTIDHLAGAEPLAARRDSLRDSSTRFERDAYLAPVSQLSLAIRWETQEKNRYHEKGGTYVAGN